MNAFERRTAMVQAELEAGQAVVLSPSENLYYLTGVWETQSERHMVALIGGNGEELLVVPELLAGEIRADTWVDDVRSWGDGDDPMQIIKTACESLEVARGELFVEPTMWTRFTEEFRTAMPAADISLADTIMNEHRVRKDDQELDALDRVATVTDAVSRAIRSLGSDAIGMTETDLADEIEERLQARGGDGTAFETIVASGPNGAHPHHTHGDRTIKPGDPVVLDFGTRMEHYPSDQTRTVVFDGQPSENFVAAHEAVLEAQAAAIDVIEPGVEAAAVDAAARNHLEDAGFGDAFIHRTGHGVGLAVHEEPYIVEGNNRPVEPGMVFSVEPGVYREGSFGVRIEDLVVVTESGCRRLNDSPREWRSQA